MKLTHTMFVLFFGGFILHFFLLPYIITKNSKHIKNSLGKLYISIIFSLLLLILEVILHDYQYNVISWRLYMVFGILLLGCIYLYKNQIAINDKQFLQDMIEHHSQSLLTSEEILKKTNDYNIAKLAKNIIQTQKDEIRIMNELLHK